MTFRLFGYPEFEPSKYWEIRDLIKAFGRKDGLFVFVGIDTKTVAARLFNLVHSSQWGHSGFLFVGINGELYAVHMTTKGLLYQPILDYLPRVDHFACGFVGLTNVDVARERINRSFSLAESTTGIEYDYSLRLDPEAEKIIIGGEVPKEGYGPLMLYCSEFMYFIIKGLTKNPLIPTKLAGSWDIFEPDDIYRQVMENKIYEC